LIRNNNDEVWVQQVSWTWRNGSMNLAVFGCRRFTDVCILVSSTESPSSS
jgi:hypothetical protein